MVFLARYAHLPPSYVEGLDLNDVMRLLRITNEWIAIENGRRNESPATPADPEW